MANGIINLTFDFDALSFWVYSGRTSPASISRGEFGAYAIERLLYLFESRGITITFFIPGHTIDTYPQQCKAIVAAGDSLERAARLARGDTAHADTTIRSFVSTAERRDTVRRVRRDTLPHAVRDAARPAVHADSARTVPDTTRRAPATPAPAPPDSDARRVP